MGIRGLPKYLATLGCNQGLNKDSVFSSSVTADHLLIDMNGVMHQCYDARDPSLTKTLQRTVNRTREIILRFKPAKSLTLVFDGAAPLAKLQTQRERRQGYSIVEVESRPAAKSASKRHAAAENSEDDDADSSDRARIARLSKSMNTTATSDRALSEAEITTGSPYLLLVEDAVTRLVLSQMVEKEELLPADLDVLISRSVDVGEGEVKISLRLQTLSPKPVDDHVVIFSGDSDTVLVGVAALNFHNIWIAHTSMNFVTSVGFLLLKWLDSKDALGLTLHMLPAARIDFVFLMNLAGGDFFTGLEEGESMMLWNRYREKILSRPPNSRLVRLILQQPTSAASAPPDCGEQQEKDDDDASAAKSSPPSSASASTAPRHALMLDPELFCDIVGRAREAESSRSNNRKVHRGGSGSGGGKTPNQRAKNRSNASKVARNQSSNANPSQGANLASFALWSLEQIVSGRCEAFAVQPVLSESNVASASLRAFGNNAASVAACRPRRTPLIAGHAATSLECLRPPLFTFIAATASISCLPGYVRRVLEENPPLRNKLARVSSSTQLAVVTDEVMALVQGTVKISNIYAVLEEAQSFPAILAQPDPTVTGLWCSNAGKWKECAIVAKHTMDDVAAVRARCMAFQYDAGTVVRFRGVTKSDISLVVPEQKKIETASPVAANAKQTEEMTDGEETSDDDGEDDE